MNVMYHLFLSRVGSWANQQAAGLADIPEVANGLVAVVRYANLLTDILNERLASLAGKSPKKGNKLL